MSYSTQNLGSLMDDIGADESAGGKAKARGGASSGPFWKSQGFAVALALIAVVVLIGGVYVSFFTGGPPKPPNSMMLMDVKTGQLFEAKLGKRGYVIPSVNPDTGERNLFPVMQDENGDWVLKQRYTEALESDGVDPSIVPDISSGIVFPSEDSPKPFKR